MDLLVIAVSDVNKPLLRGAIPVLIKGLKLRGATNSDMVVDVIQILLQLTYDAECLKDLKLKRKEISSLVHKYVTARKYDLDARLSAQNLVNALQDSPSSARPSKAHLFAGISRKAATDSAGKPEKESEVAHGRRNSSSTMSSKHIMLSYNWGVKPIVQRVEELLRKNGFKTWIDE
jgi:hypothetical protein